jgi:epoxyqueuosine reductase QueG
MNNPKLAHLIHTTFDNLENNNFSTLGTPESPMWEAPLIGIAAGNDPYFDFLKQHIGDFHWSPKDAFALKYKGSADVDPSKLRVVSMAFPQTAETKKTQLAETVCPSRNWLVSRGEWEPLLKTFSGRLVTSLEAIGIRSVSIDLQPEFSVFKAGPLGIASKWSHRHYAYAAGLGTFGLSDGLITEKGKAVRFTSLVIEAPLEITRPDYTGPYDWCLFHQNGSCGKCIDRCPCNAITPQGHDKNACLDYEDYFEANLWPEGLDRKDYIIGCGLCQVGIPCQDKRPHPQKSQENK